jgi:hypothetical protein
MAEEIIVDNPHHHSLVVLLVRAMAGKFSFFKLASIGIWNNPFHHSRDLCIRTAYKQVCLYAQSYYKWVYYFTSYTRPIWYFGTVYPFIF